MRLPVFFLFGLTVCQNGIANDMHVIAKPALVAFWTAHPPAREPLGAWYRIMRQQDFKNFNELQKTFASADQVAGFTVFDIGGNKYRLITVIHYNRQKVYVRAVLTHGEYDTNAWKRGKR